MAATNLNLTDLAVKLASIPGVLSTGQAEFDGVPAVRVQIEGMSGCYYATQDGYWEGCEDANWVSYEAKERGLELNTIYLCGLAVTDARRAAR